VAGWAAVHSISYQDWMFPGSGWRGYPDREPEFALGLWNARRLVVPDRSVTAPQLREVTRPSR